MRVEPAAADEVAARRRHPRLAEAGEQRSGEQERGPDPGRERLVGSRRRDAVGLQPKLVVADHSARTPIPSSTAIWVSVSRIRGTLLSTTSSSVSRQAARIGRAAFLLPAAVISPESGGPPWMTNFSIGRLG